MAITLERRILDLISAGHGLLETGQALGVDQSTVLAALRDLTIDDVSQAQRALNLVVSGHTVSDVGEWLAIGQGAVLNAVQDLTGAVSAPANSIRGPFSLARCYGHSYAAGGGASGFDSNAFTVLASYFGVPDAVNLAVGGSYLGKDSADGVNAGISWIAQREKRAVVRAPYTAALDLAVVWFGYEDLTTGLATPSYPGNGNPVAQAFPIFKNALRSAWSIVRSSARFYAGDKSAHLDASIVLGAPANWTAVANAGYVGGNQAAGSRIPNAIAGSVGYLTTTTNSAGGQVAITVPGDYPGSTVCPLYLLFVADPATTAGTITAQLLGGSTLGTFDLVQQVAGGTPANTSGTCDAVNGRRNLVCMRFAGTQIPASNGIPQALILTPSGLTGGTWGLAEWGIEAQVPPIIITPQLDPNGLGNPGILVLQGTRAQDTLAMNQTINALLAEFPDGRVVSPACTLAGSGNIYGLGGSAGNSTPATVDSSTGFGGTTGTNCKINTGQPWPASGTAMVGQEIFTWTGATNTGGVASLSGVTRGAWNTTAIAHTGNPLTDLVNSSALPNYSGDGTHPSDTGHALFAQSMIAAAQPASLSYSDQPARSRARSRIYGIYRNSWNEQIIAPQGSGFGSIQTVLKWDQDLVDTASIHPATTSLFGSYDTIYLNANGLYRVAVSLDVGLSVVGRSTVVGGLSGIGLLRNGTQIAEDTRSFNASDFPNTIFTFGHTVVFPEFEAFSGDQLKVAAWQNGAGASTTVSDNPLAAGATTIDLAATTGMLAGDILRIDDESILIGTVASGTQLTGCTRGYHGTTAAQHTNGTAAFTGRALFGSPTALPCTLSILRLCAL